MIYIEQGVYVRVQELQGKAPPFPLESGFSADIAYRALGMHSASETSECYYILANDRDETWFISNKHLRVVGVFPEARALRFALDAPVRATERANASGGKDRCILASCARSRTVSKENVDGEKAPSGS